MSTLENKAYYIKQDKSIFIPTYAALVVKNFKDLNLKDGSLTIFSTLVLRILTTGVPEPIVESLKENIGLRICDRSVTLTPGDEGVSLKKEGDILMYTYRFDTELSFLADVRKVPFDSFAINLGIELTSNHVKADGEEFHYRFNLHLHPVKTTNISFKKNCDRLAEYEVAYPLCEVKLPPETKKTVDGSFTYFPKLTVDFIFVREPWHVLLTIVFPIIILDLITLAVFATENDLSSKIGNIATLVLALIAYLPTVRAEVPSVAYFTLCDSLVYSCILINGIALLDAVLINYIDHPLITKIVFSIAGFCFIVLCLFLLLKCFQHLRFKKKWTSTTYIELTKGSNVFSNTDWENSGLRKIEAISA